MKKNTEKNLPLDQMLGKQYRQGPLCHHPSAWNIPRLTTEERAFLESVVGKQSVLQDNKIDKNNGNSTKEQELSSKTKKWTTTKEQELEILFFNSVSKLFSHNCELTPNERITISLRRLLKQYVIELEGGIVPDAVTSVAAAAAAGNSQTVHTDHTVQQSFLSKLKSLFNGDNRSLQIQKYNGKDSIVVFRPYSKDVDGFIEQAKQSKWIDMLLPENVYRAGMLKYLAMNHYEEYKRVADVYAIDLAPVKVDTYQAQGLATELGLNSRQQENMRSWLRKYGLHLEHQPAVMKKIDREVFGE
jgi:hypothetical protein